jgi:lactate dehydrogenase-like 2-hydroxyacid dehydrogenase
MLVVFLAARCGLDVYEDEPNMTPGLSDCENVVVVPHIASASLWTRSGMVSNLSPWQPNMALRAFK